MSDVGLGAHAMPCPESGYHAHDHMNSGQIYPIKLIIVVFNFGIKYGRSYMTNRMIEHVAHA